MIINGIDYEIRAAELTDAGIPWDGVDDTAFGGKFVYCNQHLRAHTVGWCTVANVEKVALEATTIGVAEVEAEGMRVAAVRVLGAGRRRGGLMMRLRRLVQARSHAIISGIITIIAIAFLAVTTALTLSQMVAPSPQMTVLGWGIVAIGSSMLIALHVITDRKMTALKIEQAAVDSRLVWLTAERDRLRREAR